MTTTDPTYAVLHVDDEPDFLELTRARLETMADDIEYESATDAETALSMLQDDQYDCVVTDYRMGSFDGLEFLSAVRDRDPDLPVVFFTGKGSEEIASRAISIGATDYLRKHGGKNQFVLLAKRIRSLASQRAAQRELDRAAALVRQTYERITDCVVSLDSDGRVTYLNSHAESLFGRSRDDLAGERLLELVPELAETSIREQLSDDEADAGSIITVYAESLSAWLSVAVYLGDDGSTVFLTDVTADKQREEEIDELQEALATSESKFRSLDAKISRPMPAFRGPN